MLQDTSVDYASDSSVFCSMSIPLQPSLSVTDLGNCSFPTSKPPIRTAKYMFKRRSLKEAGAAEEEQGAEALALSDCGLSAG